MEKTRTMQEKEEQGWTRQFIIETERAGEFAEVYEELGEEVCVEPVTPDHLLTEECSTCLMAECDKYVVIYTRTKK
ncbi:MAG: hypothetical protein GTO18_18775 [Anaerolineales bacterium]|nr:hypothetical protein [Anaerolineales bacterium]